jgi:hypothetical protein
MVAMGNCLRLVISLLAYESYGSIILTTIYMFRDVATFIVVWYLVLMMFSMIALFVFSEVKVMATLPDSMLYFINASFGGYDLSVFNIYAPDRPFIRGFGIGFILVFVFLNMLILLNVLIAMMADTYSLMTSLRKGLYNNGIIRQVVAYKPRKDYGGLLINVPPFSVIAFILLPVYIFVKDRAVLEKLTYGFSFAFYSFVLLILSIYYIIANLVMTPFAYLFTTAHKMSLLCKGRIHACTFLLQLLAGLPMLIVAQFTDLFTFVCVSFTTRKLYQSDEIHVLTIQQFNYFNKILQHAAATKKHVRAKELLMIVREGFEVTRNITVVIYGVGPGAKGSKWQNDLVNVNTTGFRTDSIDCVKSYKVIKKVIWSLA